MSTAPPRVLLGCDWFVRYAAGLAAGLADNGAAVTLLTRTHDGEFGAVAGAMRAHVAGRLGAGVPHLRLPGRVRDPRGLIDLARVLRAVGRLAPDVVHLQDSVVNDPRLLMAARARRGRYALTVHDLERHPGDPAMSRARLIAWRACIQGAGLIFVHAEPLRERLLTEHRPRAAVVVVPHGVDVPLVRPLPAQPALLLFGRMSGYKGLDTLLDAMPLVWERLPEARLTVAGDGAIAPRPELGDPRVTVRNEFVPDAELPELFAAATCVVLPYREASQSGVAADAKRFGRALVVTGVGGLADAARDGAARVVPPADPRALAEAVLDVLRTPGLAERMGRAAAASGRGGSSWSHVGALTLDAYRRHLAVPARR
jgi:glycosyltransferase involved in cell wall biosynthesis